MAAQAEPCPAPRPGAYSSLFAPKHRRATILASVPWFTQDMGTYGIGIFTPTILAAVIGASAVTDTNAARNVADLIHNNRLATKGAAFLDLLLVFGMGVAILLVDKIGRIRMQVFGFLGCAAGLATVAASLDAVGQSKTLLRFSGFMIFNFMNNLGPYSMTYLPARSGGHLGVPHRDQWRQPGAPWRGIAPSQLPQTMQRAAKGPFRRFRTERGPCCVRFPRGLPPGRRDGSSV